MAPTAIVRALASLVAPPLCGACGRPCAAVEPICSGCAGRVAGARGGLASMPGIGLVSWAAPYEGVARELVAALKFGGRIRLAEVLGEAVAAAVGARATGATVVAVPPAPLRRRLRGFDSAELVAAAVAGALALELAAPLRRADGPRQVGRRRCERLASPPRVRATRPAPAIVLLVDDVLTTGATLRSCAAALRDAGAGEVRAAVFAHSLGASDRAA